MDPIETDRLLLREMTLEDAPFICELLNSPTWIKYIGDRDVRTAEDAAAYMSKNTLASYREHGFGTYLAILKESNTPIGTCGLIKRPSLEDVDIGFAFMPDHLGKGYGYESAKEVMHYAEHVIGLKKIVAITLPSNTASIRLLEKLGLKIERSIQLPNDSEELLLYARSF